mgnify:CR=1 FL=1|tara:strand:+ start:124 stop:531 length:408 start_codon:yes stop_codon:yes gene_type:complete
MKHLRQIIRNILVENKSSMDKLIDLLVSNDVTSIHSATELGEILGYFKVHYKSKAAQTPGETKIRRGKRRARYPQWILHPTPEFFAQMRARYPNGVSHNRGSQNIGWCETVKKRTTSPDGEKIEILEIDIMAEDP